MAGVIINLIMFILFFIFAVMLSKGKGAFLIAGYNTMSDREKAQYDEAALCKFMSNIMYGICLSILMWALSELLDNQALFVIGLILFIGIILFAVVYSNTGNRFKR
ncbi:DUF3784 domain-containing protein [Siminovitchia acidinfaciens]|uniref:DUF3784 domain-containing protein n=1 Tax=Siminovitchia acidinfaciens TaxID=2321395 RepID=A0A429XUJ4_9BACI|nr:DUF3784 domain-containing protein [Siminovitchia acidinfaciens]RST71821.1 DUF3784 domain-containing protein [Siminovitchia acidinfaciens]